MKYAILQDAYHAGTAASPTHHIGHVDLLDGYTRTAIRRYMTNRFGRIVLAEGVSLLCMTCDHDDGSQTDTYARREGLPGMTWRGAPAHTPGAQPPFQPTRVSSDHLQ